MGPEAEPATARDEATTEAALAAIVDAGRRTRKPLSKSLWIAAIVVGAVCLVGFVVLLVAEPSEVERARPAATQTGLGFVGGLVIGAALGIVIGIAIARRLEDETRRSDAAHSSGNSPDHSSRNSP